MKKEKIPQSREVVSEALLSEIKRLSQEAFANLGSPSYRQKLVYNLLNLVKAKDDANFLWNLLRVLNSQKGNEKIIELTEKINYLYPLSQRDFEKLAYSIIMGIMSVKMSEEGGGHG